MAFETQKREEIKPQWRARLDDALNISTRGKRRLLLVISTVSLVAIILGIFPTKIQALGIDIETKNQRDLFILLGAVNLYALIGFILYAWADILLQFRVQQNANTGYIHEFIKDKDSILSQSTTGCAIPLISSFLCYTACMLFIDCMG